MFFRIRDSRRSERYWSTFSCYLFRATINSFLVIDLIGCCCVYIVFISSNVKEVVDYYSESDRDVRLYMAVLLPLLIIFSLVRNLKYLAPFSMIANVLIATGMGITFYYIFSDLPSISNLPNFSSWSQLPLFFGTAIFALEGIGVVSTRRNTDYLDVDTLRLITSWLAPSLYCARLARSHLEQHSRENVLAISL